MSEFLYESRSEPKRLSGGGPELFAIAGRTFHDFVDYCKNAEKCMSTDVGNLEVVYCLAEALHEAGVEPVPLESGSTRVDELIAHVKLWLWKIYHRLPPLDDNSLGKPYELLMEMAKPLASRLAFVTTNYDLVVEYFAWKSNTPVCYPLGPGAGGGHQDPVAATVSLGQPAGSYCTIEEDSQRPLLCKLHGSVNYVQRPCCNHIEVVDGLAEAGSCLGGSCIPSLRPAILALDALPTLRKLREHQDAVPAIVPPTYAKLERQKWLRRIWNAAYESIRSASTILFIGYSFPDSDGFMRALFRAAMAARRGPAPPRVCVIDRDEKTLRRYSDDLFKPLGLAASKNLIQKPFEDSLEDIGRILAEAT